MKKFSVPTAQANLCIGIYFRVVGATAENARSEWRQSLKDHFPASIKMPCGQEFNYQTFDDIPITDTPCPCGNPKHWLVKYALEEAKS